MRSDTAHREALLEFTKHANDTNDIFLLAAKAISSTILRYHKLKANRLEEKVKYDTSCSPNHCNISLLLEAWRPISVGYKRRWWDCVALPDDVDSSNEASFRMQLKELAFESLQLLKTPIFDKECEPLFSLEIYGHIIGMFEQNNLDLVVASPVEDYFLYIDDLPYPKKDRDGQATIIALRSINKGEEIRISYVDEDLPFEERQASLADYGFRCKCPKCIEEEP